MSKCTPKSEEMVKDFAKYLIKEIESLPKTPNGHSKTYDEAMMINIIENCLEDYIRKG